MLASMTNNLHILRKPFAVIHVLVITLHFYVVVCCALAEKDYVTLNKYIK